MSTEWQMLKVNSRIWLELKMPMSGNPKKDAANPNPEHCTALNPAASMILAESTSCAPGMTSISLSLISFFKMVVFLANAVPSQDGPRYS
jgi:hypothetical protein